jgi:hypothetical protein
MRHGVTIMMAGDTHDLEYYSEPGGTSATTVHYFVNGGGGAYLSFGTALQWPAQPQRPTGRISNLRCGVSEDRGAHALVEVAGLVVDTALRRLADHGRVALADVRLQRRSRSSRASSKLKVEPSAHRVRLIPHGVNGCLTLGDVATSASFRRPAPRNQTPLEWIVPMR